MPAVLERNTDAHTALAWELQTIAGRPLAQVIVWPRWDERDGGHRRMWTALAIGLDGCEVPLPGRVIPVINLLRRTFPLAPWGRPQRYRIREGALTKYTPRLSKPFRNHTGGTA
jgi:hypothetical protein